MKVDYNQGLRRLDVAKAVCWVWKDDKTFSE